MNSNRTFLTLVLATFFWGANFNVGKYAVAHASPLHIASWRFAIASVLMAAIFLFKERKVDWTSVRRNLVTYVVMGLVGIFGFNALFFFGLQSTTALNGSLIMALNPSFAVVMAAFAFRQKIQLRQVLGLGLSMIGVLVVVTNASLTSLLALSFSRGDLLILLGNVCWAAYAVIAKKFIRGGSPLQTTAFSMVAGAIMLGALAAAETAPAVAPEHVMGITLATLFMAIFGSVLAYLWWNGAIAKIGSARTAVFFDLVPIFTMIISLVRGETVTAMQGAGSLLVIVGVLFSSGFDVGAFLAKLQGRSPAPASTAPAAAAPAAAVEGKVS